MEMDQVKKIETLTNDSVFIEQLMDASSKEQIENIFFQNGVELTDEEAELLLQKLQNEDKLDEEMLDGISGGCLPVIIGGVVFASYIAYLVWIKKKMEYEKKLKEKY